MCRIYDIFVTKSGILYIGGNYVLLYLHRDSGIDGKTNHFNFGSLPRTVQFCSILLKLF
jgi:hypothetical protein